MRKAAKRDGNEKELVLAMRRLGASVVYLSLANAPDLLVGFRGKTFLFETKTPKGKLRPGQVKFAEDWQGSPVHVIRTLEDVLKIWSDEYAGLRISMSGLPAEDSDQTDVRGSSPDRMCLWW